MTDPDAMAAFRDAERRLRALLFGDGVDVMGMVRGEERRQDVTRELRRMHQAFESALQGDEHATGAEPHIAELEEELRRLAASRARAGSLLTIDEVARRLRISRSTVYRRIEAGELPAVRLGTHARAPLRVDAQELDRWLRGRPESAATVAGEAAPRMDT